MLFPNWKAFLDFAESFPNLSDGQRRSSGDSIKLCSTLWVLTGNRKDYYAIEYIAASSLVFAQKAEFELPEAGAIADKVFSDEGAKTKGDFIECDEVLRIVNMMHENPVHYYLMYCLSHTPLKNKTPTTWNNLANIDVGKLLTKQVSFVSSAGYISLTVRDAIIAAIMGGIHDYADTKLPFFINAMFDEQLLISERKRLISALARDQSRVEVGYALDSIFSKHLKESVLEAITLPEKNGGFIDDRYYSSPEKNIPPISTQLGRESESVAGHTVTVFRDGPLKAFDNAGAELYRVLSIAKDSSGVVSGFLNLTLIKNPSGKVSGLGAVADEFENRDCIEMSLSLSERVGFRSNQPAHRLAFITSWEVSRHYRSLGLGRALMNAAFDWGLKDFGQLDYVVAKLEPAEYPIPPLDDFDYSVIPNYYRSKLTVNEIWNKVTLKGTQFGLHRCKFHSSGYKDACHGHPNLLMMAMACYPPAFHNA